MTRIELIKKIHQDLLGKVGSKPIVEQETLEQESLEEEVEEQTEHGEEILKNLNDVSDKELDILKHTQGYCRGSIIELVDGDVEE